MGTPEIKGPTGRTSGRSEQDNVSSRNKMARA